MTEESPERRTTTPTGPAPAAPGLVRRMWLARFALGWERAWPALWPALTVAGTFTIVALLDLLPRLNAVLHAAALALFAAALVAALWRARGALTLPAREAGRRRLEIASGFVHRPLAALEDDIAAGKGDPQVRALWRAHRDRILARLASVRVGAPRPGMPLRDPRALRLLLVLALAVAVGAGGERAGRNFARALTPGVDDVAALPGVLDLWITPPAYTGLPPVLPRADTGIVSVPVGSRLIAQVSGGGTLPRLTIDAKPLPFAPAEGAAAPPPGAAPVARPQPRLQSWRVAGELSEGTRLSVEQGKRTLGAWELKLIPDQLPKVEFVQPPQEGQRASLRLEYRASDDYGVAGVQAEIRRDAPPGRQGVGTPIDLALPMTSARAKETGAPAVFDLTAHPWAGLPVTVTLRATDVAGQTGASEAVRMILPQRVFSNPVARALVELRKLVIAEPEKRPVVARALAAIASNPVQFGEDPVVVLSLRVGALRLQKPIDDPAVEEMQALMWDTALRLEDGRLSAAERELRAIQQKLQDALANNAPDSEIEKLMAELQQAIDRYLQSLVEQALKNPDRSQQPPDRNTQRMTRQDLQKLLDQARKLAQTGAREAARDLLSRLQEMLENLRTMQAQRDGQQQRGQPGDQGAQEMMKQLQELMQRQQSLIDRTFRRSQQGRPGQFRPGQQGQQGQRQQGQQQGQGQGEGEGDDAGEQEALRGMLSEMMRQLGEMMGQVPGGLGRADRSMGDAGDQLRRGAPGRALRPQMDALDQLRQGAREAMREMMQRFGRAEGEGQGSPDDAFGDQQADQRDPLGRNPEGDGTSLSDSFQRIPGIGEGQVQRSQEILDELIRRLGERSRPAVERDYLERLLKRF